MRLTPTTREQLWSASYVCALQEKVSRSPHPCPKKCSASDAGNFPEARTPYKAPCWRLWVQSKEQIFTPSIYLRRKVASHLEGRATSERHTMPRRRSVARLERIALMGVGHAFAEVAVATSGLGFNGVVIDLQQHFETYPNYQILPKFTNKIYDNVADFRQLRAVESQPGCVWAVPGHTIQTDPSCLKRCFVMFSKICTIVLPLLWS